MKKLPHLKLFAKNLNLLLEQSGLTDSELAERMGVGNSSVSRWARAEIFPSTVNFEELCTYFQVPPKFFFDNNDDDVTISEVNVDTVDMYSMNTLAHHLSPIGRINVAKDTRMKNRRLFAAYCEDDAMDNVIHPPSMCYINPDLKPHTGSIVLVQVASDEIPIFRQYTKGGSTVILSGMSHSEEVDDIILKEDEIYSILGVVVEVRTQFVQP